MKQNFPYFPMKKSLLIVFCLFANSLFAQNVLQKLGESLTKVELDGGLKEALIQGITKGTTSASALDGFLKNPLIKLPFPEDVKNVEDRLRKLGLGSEVDKFVVSLNRAAEDASKSALPIFLDAIKNVSIQDGLQLLNGDEKAATEYLKRSTTEKLVTAFMPIVSQSLDKVNATKYYGELVGRYNKIPLIQKVNPDLKDYATKKAIEGLFKLVAGEEKEIRTKIGARKSDLLKKVFGGGN